MIQSSSLYPPLMPTMVSPKSSKKKKKMRIEEDRLSELPDHILHHIFSFLSTKQVIQSTCLLSKYWTNFSTSLPCLYFNIKNTTPSHIDNDEAAKFRGEENRERHSCSSEFVNKFLCKGGSDLQRLGIRWLDCDKGSRVKQWIGYALYRNIQELDVLLRLDPKTMFTAPAKLFSAASSVKVIRLESRFLNRNFRVSRAMFLAPNLRILELIKVTLPRGDSNGELLLSCPVLETLIMNKCFYNHLKVVNLSLNRLKKLEIDNMGNYLLSPCDRLVDCKLELHTLNLLTFVYKGTMFKNWSIGNLVGLIDVDLFVPPLVFSHSEWYTRFEGHWVKLFKALNGARTFAINFALLDKVEPVPPLPYTLDYLKYYYVPIEGVEELNNKFEFLGALFKNAVNLERMTITALFQQFPEFGEDAHRERIPEFRDKLMALFQQFPNLQVSLQVS